MKHHKKTTKSLFNRFSNAITKATGHPIAFAVACSLVIAWAILGPFMDFSERWQLTINTGTTIVTFLMVFIIQQSQNRETMAIQLKLNELIGVSETASNRLVDIEDLTETELEKLKKFYVTLSELSKKDFNIHTSHSIDEATEKHSEKMKVMKGKK